MYCMFVTPTVWRDRQAIAIPWHLDPETSTVDGSWRFGEGRPTLDWRRDHIVNKFPPAFLGVECLPRIVWCSGVVDPHRRNSKKPVCGTETEVPLAGNFGVITGVTVLSEGTGEVPLTKHVRVFFGGWTLARLWRRNCLGEWGWGSISAVLRRRCHPRTVITLRRCGEIRWIVETAILTILCSQAGVGEWPLWTSQVQCHEESKTIDFYKGCDEPTASGWLNVRRYAEVPE